jgi:hypothetical protein
MKEIKLHSDKLTGSERPHGDPATFILHHAIDKLCVAGARTSFGVIQASN